MEFNTEQAVPISTESTNDENNNVQLQEIHETVNILAGGITVLNDDVQRLSNEFVRMRSSIESLTQDCASIQMSVEEQTAFLNGIKINQDIIQQDLESLKQTVDDIQHASYDGTLIWKITNVREKMSKFYLKNFHYLY
jgi:chromosome segregation ATPase